MDKDVVDGVLVEEDEDDDVVEELVGETTAIGVFTSEKTALVVIKLEVARVEDPPAPALVEVDGNSLSADV